MPFPPTLAVEEPSGDPPVEGLLAGEPSSASEVDFLDPSDAVEGRSEEPRRITRCMDPVEGILVSVQGDYGPGLVGLRGFLTQDDDNFPGDNGEGSETPRWVAED